MSTPSSSTQASGRNFPACFRLHSRALFAAVLLFGTQAPLAAQAPPAAFTAEVSRNSSDKVTVDFTHHPIRHENFQVLLVEADGSIATHTPLPPRTYLGTVQGHSGAIACGWLRPDGTLFARVAFEDGVEWFSAGGNVSVRGSTTWQPAWPTTVVPAGGAGGVVYAAETGVDLTYRQLVASGGTPDLAAGMAEYAVMSANYIFLRDAAILHRIGRVVIRMAESNDPYQAPASVTTSTLLNEVKNQWNNVIPVGTSHQVALVAHPSVNGGLAWVGVIGTSANRYSANDSDSNGDFSVVWRHEVGHNWGANHYEGGGRPEGPTIMSDNSLPRFSSSELERILAHRNSRLGILGAIPNYPFPLPPRANMVRASVIAGETAIIDALANDSDANGDAISILSFDATCSRGGTVTRLVGAGPGGRDLLGYTPHPEFQNGTAFFRYRLSDATGRTATGYVMLRPAEESFQPLHHWALDETSGSTAIHATSGPDGTHVNNPTLGVPGATAVTGRGVTYNGTSQSTTIPALGLSGNSYTFTAWIRRNGSQSNGAPILYSRNSNASNDSYTGLYLSSNQLRVRWNGQLFTPSPTLSVPTNEWCLAAFSVSPTQVAVHLRSAMGLTTSIHNTTISAAPFNHPFLLARSQPTSGSTLYFGGSIDDVRIFPGVLSAAQVGALWSQAASPPDFAIVNPEPGQPVNPSGTRFIAGSTQSAELLRSVEFYDAATTYSFGVVNSAPFALTVDSLDSGTLLLGARAAYGDWGYRVEAAPVSLLVLEASRPVVTLSASGQPSFGGAGTRFVFRRDSSQGVLEVTFALSGTAVRDADYTLPGTSVVFANGQSELTIDLTPAAAPSSPGEKSATLTLTQTADFVIESPSSATIVFADSVRSVAGGNWSETFVWSNSQPAPVTGTQGTGPDYIVMGGHVVRSYDENSNTQGMVARSLRVTGTGRLELARTHAATLQNVTYNIPRVSLDAGGTLRFVATTGSSGHQLAAPIEAIGNATIQFSGGSYDQFANLSGPISGTGNLTMQSLSNAGATAANIRTFSILSAGNSFSGNWSIEHTPSGDDFGALRAAAVNALGSGGVTVKRRSRLINDQSGGLDSLSFITLEGQTSSLLLNQPTQAPDTALTLNSSSAEVVLGNATSTLGSLAGTAGSIRGSGANSILAVRQTQNASFAGSIGQNLRLRKLGSARLELTGPIDTGSILDLAEGRLSPGGTPRTIAGLVQSGGILELPAPASPSTPRLTVTGAAAFSGGTIEITFPSAPQPGVSYSLLAYQGTLTGQPKFTFNGTLLPALIDYGTGSNSVVAATFLQELELTLVASPAGRGEVGGAGIYQTNSAAAITATPSPGWAFAAWSGSGVADPAAASTTVLMDASKTITAHFERSGSAELVWRGNDPAEPNRWDTGITANWENAGLPDTFRVLDDVRFDDSATTFHPQITGQIEAGTLTFDLQTNACLLGGPGGIAQAAVLIKSGAATATIASANTFTGPVAVTGGRLVLSNAAAMGDSLNGAKAVTVTGGGQLDLNGFNNNAPARTYTLRIAGAGPDGSGALVNTGSSITSNAGMLHLELLADATIGGTNRFDIGLANGNATQGTITANGHTLSKTGGNQIMLRGDASATPIQIVVQQGILGIENHDAALGGATGQVTVQNGAVLGAWGERTIATPLILAAGSTLRALGGGAATWTGPITLGGAAAIDLSGQAKSIAGNLSGPGGFTKTGGNTLTLSGNNSHAGGTTITLGQVNVTSHSAFGAGPVEFQHATSSGTVTRANLINVTIENDIILNTNAATGFRGPLNTGSGNTLSVLSGTVTVQSNTGNGGHFSSLDGGVLRLSGTLNSTGTIPNLRSGIIEMATTGGNLTQLNQGEGTIRLAADNGIQPGVRLNLAISAAGTLDLNGHHQTFAELRRNGTPAATVTNTATTAAVLAIDGTVDHIFNGTITDGSGGISLAKKGTSVFTLTGSHGYTGDTTVAAGTLDLDTPFLADSSSLHLTRGATLHLSHDSTDTIAALYLDGVQQAAGIYDAENSAFLTGSGALSVTTGPPPATPYDDWLLAAGLTPGEPGTGPNENSDGSGVPNLIQFALGGNPNDPVDNGIHMVFDSSDGVTGPPFLITIAAREGAVFAGSPSPAATIDGVITTLTGSDNLADWSAAVEEVVPAFDANGLLSAPPGYQLHSFRLANPPPESGQGFLRVGVAAHAQ
jgi:autotransporter-associated beta strand protein